MTAELRLSPLPGTRPGQGLNAPEPRGSSASATSAVNSAASGTAASARAATLPADPSFWEVWTQSLISQLPVPGLDPAESGDEAGFTPLTLPGIPPGISTPVLGDSLQGLPAWTWLALTSGLNATGTSAPDQPGQTDPVEQTGATGTGTQPPGTARPGEDGSVARLVALASARYGVPAGLVMSVIAQESGFRPNAQSPAGAQGLMQLMPDTARMLGVTDPFDPAQNIDGGVRYLAQLLTRYGGDVPRALAAYNAGPAAVDHYGGIPPYPETVQYVQSVLSRWTGTAR
ncbi:lytic transglycosylase domain-containing protein [Alicyclobacillus macrosporangiidus]|uniref:transglycosylase SLT domain-containing protein n=1 Tax=Alicyclobacillus macrosporangiidus TaxID=392015 RepID=UPI0009E07EF1